MDMSENIKLIMIGINELIAEVNATQSPIALEQLATLTAVLVHEINVELNKSDERKAA